MSFNPKEFEEKIYNKCEELDLFEVNGNNKIIKDGKYFSLLMPPPNITGILHIGHALTFTLQDIIVRYKRMDGYKTLWQCGTDHAGIATQNVVLKQLQENGIDKKSISREEFIEHVYDWKKYSGGTIVKQMKKLGITPSWSRERFTMDEGMSRSVKEVFTKLYNDKLIVKDKYMINWCINDGAISDIEVEYTQKDGYLYNLKYFLSDSDEYLVLATTRPETLFGDSAIMVHPDDKRYQKYIGKKVKIPLCNREIDIISDRHVDIEFGTGVVKVTPAHDHNDYEVGLRNSLEFYTIFDSKGILNEMCGSFVGKSITNVRDSIVDKLEELGYVESITAHSHQVGTCYRCKSVIEPYISSQWFLRKEIATNSIIKTKEGLVKFHPSSWINSYSSWMDNLKDWCISRQLWWGHQIPVFYCDSCSHVWASVDDETSCPKCSSRDIRQDEDVLDTWFSSSLLAFSTFGKFNGEYNKDKYKNSDLSEFYPNSLLITGFDILFFWVSRMMMMGEYLLGELPFKDIYLHALVRDEHGDKMSKSKGNVIDPLVLIDEYSSDVVRFTLASLTVLGRDIKIGKKHLDVYKNFTNKLYNASRYLLLNRDRFENLSDIEVKSDLGIYMYSRLSLTISEVRENLDKYRFSDVTISLYKFFWDDFCDWGIELSKSDSGSISELGAIFKEALLMLSPIMPFISEKLYADLSGYSIDEIDNENAVMVQPFPSINSVNDKIVTTYNAIKDLIASIRRVKVSIDQSSLDILYINFNSKFDVDKILIVKNIEKMCNVNRVEIIDSDKEDALVFILQNCKFYISKGSMDISSLKDKLDKKIDKLFKERDKVLALLQNSNFTKNAPQDVLNKNNKLKIELDIKIENIKKEIEFYT